MPSAALPGVDLWYEVAGEGPPVLAINGSGSDLRRRPGLLESPLVRSATTLTYDHRGLGRSAPTGHEPPAMHDFAADALALCDHLGWERFAVLGISFGGMVAQELALLAGERVTRLVLACTSAGGAGGASAPLHEIYPLSLAERAPRLAAVNDLRTADDPERRAAIVAFIEASAEPGDPPPSDGLVRQLEARRHHDTFDRLPRIAVPTLVAAGRHDGIAPLSNAEAIAGQIPGAVLEVFEGGHVFFLEDRTAFPRIIDFLVGG